MSKWRDFLDGTRPSRDLESLLETLIADLNLLKPRTLNEEAKKSSMEELVCEIRLKMRQLKHDNEVLQNKIAILEEDLDL